MHFVFSLFLSFFSVLNNHTWEFDSAVIFHEVVCNIPMNEHAEKNTLIWKLQQRPSVGWSERLGSFLNCKSSLFSAAHRLQMRVFWMLLNCRRTPPHTHTHSWAPMRLWRHTGPDHQKCFNVVWAGCSVHSCGLSQSHFYRVAVWKWFGCIWVFRQDTL